MERDIFIISVYCLVVEIMQKIENSYKFRRAGFAPKRTDAKVITIEICGEFFKLHEDPRFTSISNGTIWRFSQICLTTRPLCVNQLIFGKPSFYVNQCC